MTSLSFQFIASMHIVLAFWVWMGTTQETDPSTGTPSFIPTTAPSNSTESDHSHHSDANAMTYMASLFLAVPTILGLSAAVYLVKTNFSLKRNNEEKDDEHAVEDKIYTAMMMNSSHSLKMGMTNPMLLKASQRQRNDPLTKKDQVNSHQMHEKRSDQQVQSGSQISSGQDLEQGMVETKKQPVQTFGAVGALLTFGSWLNTSSSSISLSSCHLPLNHTLEGEESKMNMMEDEEGGGGQDIKGNPRSKQVKRGWWSIFGVTRSTSARNLCYVDILRDESVSDRFLELTVATPMEESDAYLINQDALVTARKQIMGRSASSHEDIQLNLRI